MKCIALAAAAALILIHPASAQPADYAQLVASHAAANGVPPELVHRVIMRESRYNPRAVSKGNYGMMQIRLATARGLGYTGSAQGLLDPETNLTYAVKYLAGAYRAAGGNHNRAVAYYAGGYYYAAKRQRLIEQRQAIAVPQPAFLDANAAWVEQPVRSRHRRHR
jgi:soluble lytic murein transglycosylase-like protein